jgi:hypothetical protein
VIPSGIRFLSFGLALGECCSNWQQILHIPHRPPTVFEVKAELWNSSKFNPVAPPSDCHLDFQGATLCTYDLLAGVTPATPQKIEDSMASIRSDLLQIITCWEQTGQARVVGMKKNCQLPVAVLVRRRMMSSRLQEPLLLPVL